MLNLGVENVSMQLCDYITTATDQIQQLFDQVRASRLPTSCASLPPSSPSGVCPLQSSKGSVLHVYCDMTLSCGSIMGGWMRLVELDMRNSGQLCPNGLRERIDGNIRTHVEPIPH